MTQRRLKGVMGAVSPEWGKTIQTAADNEVRMLEAGVPLLMASDGGLMDPDEVASNDPRAAVDLPFALGEGHFLWLRAMGEKGMRPMDAILAATRNVAAAYHRLDQLGTLEKGKLADLVILDADPLADLENVRKISVVMKEGRVIDRDQLPLKKILTVLRTPAGSLR
jgi:cytosine/adenosine deaminase-related metal-dependent hydrolase